MMHTVLPLVSTCFVAVSAICVGSGWFQIMKGNREKHKKWMSAGALFALLFFLVYMSRTVLAGNTLFSETAPAWIRDAYYVFLMFHIVLAAVSAVFGVVTLLLAYRKRFGRHRKIGRVTAVLWLVTAPTGVAVYILLYVLYPGGTTRPVLDVLGKMVGAD